MFHVKLPGHDAIARQAGEHLVTQRVKLPRKVVERPIRQVVQRLIMALVVLVATAFVVYADHDGYHDNSDGAVDLLDAFYYATVTLSTTGYGDITPVSDGARLTNIFVITPLRVLFLIILVGTTLEVLTERTRGMAPEPLESTDCLMYHKGGRVLWPDLRRPKRGPLSGPRPYLSRPSPAWRMPWARFAEQGHL